MTYTTEKNKKVAPKSHSTKKPESKQEKIERPFPLEGNVVEMTEIFNRKK